MFSFEQRELICSTFEDCIMKKKLVKGFIENIPWQYCYVKDQKVKD